MTGNTRSQAQETAARQAAPRRALPWGDFGWIALGGVALVGLVSLAEIAPAWAGWLAPLRLPLGLVYVLYAPGYCLTAALFPGRQDLDAIERAGLSLGLSVAWIAVLALVLEWLPWGLFLWPVLLGELASIGLFMAVALLRRARLPADQAYAPGRLRPRAWWRELPAAERRIYKLATAALALAGLVSAWVLLVPSPAEFMTEFYILGPQGLAESYPREAAAGEPLSLTLGIHSLERGVHTYQVEVWAIDPWEAERQLSLMHSRPIELAPGETRESQVSWAMPWAGQDQVVEFYLFIDGDPEPYRRLRLWLDVEPAP